METLRSLWQHRELLFNMVSREIKARYKQSILGYFWVILNPLVQMLVMTFVFSIIMRVPSLGVPYPIFLYCALLPWTFFANALSSATNSLVANASLIKKIYFPREILPFASVVAKIIDLLLASLVFISLILIYRQSLTITVLWVPVIFLAQLIFTLGLSLAFSAFNLFYRDIQYLLRLILMLWMYVTPVIYPVDIVPARFRFVFALNPMSVLINAYREAVLAKGTPNLPHLGLAYLVGFITLFIGYKIFKKLEGVFADVI